MSGERDLSFVSIRLNFWKFDRPLALKEIIFIRKEYDNDLG